MCTLRTRLQKFLVVYQGSELLRNFEIRMKIINLTQSESPGPDVFHPRMIKELEEIAPRFVTLAKHPWCKEKQ